MNPSRADKDALRGKKVRSESKRQKEKFFTIMKQPVHQEKMIVLTVFGKY